MPPIKCGRSKTTPDIGTPPAGPGWTKLAGSKGRGPAWPLKPPSGRTPLIPSIGNALLRAVWLFCCAMLASYGFSGRSRRPAPGVLRVMPGPGSGRPPWNGLRGGGKFSGRRCVGAACRGGPCCLGSHGKLGSPASRGGGGSWANPNGCRGGALGPCLPSCKHTVTRKQPERYWKGCETPLRNPTSYAPSRRLNQLPGTDRTADQAHKEGFNSQHTLEGPQPARSTTATCVVLCCHPHTVSAGGLRNQSEMSDPEMRESCPETLAVQDYVGKACPSICFAFNSDRNR